MYLQMAKELEHPPSPLLIPFWPNHIALHKITNFHTPFFLFSTFHAFYSKVGSISILLFFFFEIILLLIMDHYKKGVRIGSRA